MCPFCDLWSDKILSRLEDVSLKARRNYVSRCLLRVRDLKGKLLAVGAVFILTILTAWTDSTIVFASVTDADIRKVKNPMVVLISSMLRPALALVGTIGTLYCITLGIRMVRSKGDDEKRRAKYYLKNAVIGFALIFGLILGLNIGIPLLISWVNENATGVS